MGHAVLKLRSTGNTWVHKIELPRRMILRVSTNPHLPAPLRPQHALLVDSINALPTPAFALTFVRNPETEGHDVTSGGGVILLDPALHYLTDGDVVRVTPDLKVSALFRKNANAHSVLLTERCNSLCIMCSQPPRDVDDSYIAADILEALPLFDRGAKEIGFTGGEPTLLGPRFIELIRATKSFLPSSSLHILSNGRNFSNLQLAMDVSAVDHPDLMIGIPVYSDVPALHDFVVQADGAFDETIRGIINLKRCNVRVELRVVLHRHTIDRLSDLCRFFIRNLLFVDHVALMGLELMGFGKSNMDELWIDPYDYREELERAVTLLSSAGFRTSIYNHQLCTLTPRSRTFSVRSISDWKNEYMTECSGCAAQSACGGFFSSSHLRHSAHILPLAHPEGSGALPS